MSLGEALLLFFGVVMLAGGLFFLLLVWKYRSRGETLPAVIHGLLLLGVGVAGVTAPLIHRNALSIAAIALLLMADFLIWFLFRRFGFGLGSDDSG